MNVHLADHRQPLRRQQAVGIARVDPEPLLRRREALEGDRIQAQPRRRLSQRELQPGNRPDLLVPQRLEDHLLAHPPQQFRHLVRRLLDQLRHTVQHLAHVHLPQLYPELLQQFRLINHHGPEEVIPLPNLPDAQVPHRLDHRRHLQKG